MNKLSEAAYNELKRKYFHVSSWAIWQLPGATPKSNTGDMSVFNSKDLITKLNPNYIFIGLNASSTHGNFEDQTPWHNFHSDYSHQNDYKLRYALMNTPYWGSYMTDAIKEYPEVDSGRVASYLKSHPEVVKHNMDILEDEIRLLGGSPVLVAMGTKAYDILNKYMGNKYKVVEIKHYSFTIGKEDYRNEVLSVLDNIQ